MELKDNIRNIQWDLLSLKRKINKQIRLLPDNPNINRISNICYTIMLSEIQKDKNFTLSAEYYDFKFQYRKIIKKLKDVSPLETYNCISKMIVDKSFKVNSGTNIHGVICYHTIKLHPSVIEFLKGLID